MMQALRCQEGRQGACFDPDAYTALPGVPDELLECGRRASGRSGDLIHYLDHLAGEDRERGFSRGDQYLRDAGVFSAITGRTRAERDWPLSHAGHRAR
jgi:hypothetical protein